MKKSDLLEKTLLCYVYVTIAINYYSWRWIIFNNYWKWLRLQVMTCLSVSVLFLVLCRVVRSSCEVTNDN